MTESDSPPLNRAARRRVATHNDLLDAVRSLMMKHVGPNFTVTEITDLADVAPGTFYNHFDDRDAAIDAALLRDVEAHDRAVERLQFEGMDAVDRLAMLYTVNIHRVFNHPNWASFAVASYGMRRWPSLDTPGPAHPIIVDGIAEGSMGISDAVTGWLLTRHLLIGLAERLIIATDLDMLATSREILDACATILDFDRGRVNDMSHRDLAELAGTTWE